MRRTLLLQFSPVIEVSGSSSIANELAEALELQWRHGFTIPKGQPQYTTGFHPYQAAMNPALARRVLGLLDVPRGGVLFDPFCGSGTALIEGAAHFGLKRAIGFDVSPLAAFVAAHQSWFGADSDLERLGELAAQVRGKVRANYESRDELKAWAPICRTLHELGQGLDAGDAAATKLHEDLARLWFCASAALAAGLKKSSKQKPPGLAFSGAVAEFCSRVRAAKAARTAAGAGVTILVPGEDPPVSVVRGSALDVGFEFKLGNQGAASSLVDVVFSSPPYPGVYDYVSEARAFRELLTRHTDTGGVALPTLRGRAAGTDAANSSPPTSLFLEFKVPSGRDWPEEFDSRAELGAYKAMKRSKKDLKGFPAAWREKEAAWVGRVASHVKPGGAMALMVGDGPSVDGLASLRESTIKCGLLTEVAAASIRRKATSNGKGPPPGNRRTEHLVLFLKM